MNVALFIAQRLGLKAGQQRQISPGIVVGYVGVALAITIMLLSLFVVSGFKKEIREKLLGFNAPITILAPENSDSPAFTSGIRLTDTLQRAIRSVVPEAETYLTIQQPAIFKTETDFQGIVLKGIDSKAWSFFEDNMIDGEVATADSLKNAVVISTSTASKLGVNIGDRLTTHFLDNNNIRTRKLTVMGIFETHFQEFDDAFAATPIATLQELNHVDTLTATAIEIRNIPFDAISDKAGRLQEQLLKDVISSDNISNLPKISTIENSCGQYLNWLDLLDTNVVVIIILMACVSGFTLISSLFIIILEHVNTIGLLKALGATNGQIRRIFIYMAQKLVVGGIVIGNLLAVAIGAIQQQYHIIPLDPAAYYLNNVPIDMNWATIVIVDLATVAIAALILILPSHLIAKLSPALSLRYE